jgi:superfamily I DNA/RNA helicase
VKDAEDLNLLTDAQINYAKSTGFHPIIIPTRTEQDAHMRLINELRQLAGKDDIHAQANILIIHAQSEQLFSLQKALVTQLPKLHFHDTKSGPPPQKCFGQFSTLNAATGLEASIVFLLGVDSLIQKESSPHLTTEERDEIITQNTQKLYMGFTRAAQKLVVFSEHLNRVAT